MAPSKRAIALERGGTSTRTDEPGSVSRTVLTRCRTLRHVIAAVLVMAALGACSPDEPATDVRASPIPRGASARVHSADEPCENGRPDEQGAPTPPDDIYVDDEVLEWPRAAPFEAGFDEGGLESVVHDVGLSSTVLSLLVVRGGELVVEEYFNGSDAAHAHDVFSTTKLLTALAIGAAADDGIVAGLDTTLGEWVDEIAGHPAARITLEQLLSMRSGLATEGNEPFSANVVANAPLANEPGSTYAYVTDNSELLALGLDRRVPGGMCRYVHERVLDPMGVSVDHWHETPYGNVTGGSYAFLTPRELARLGQLLLDRGRWVDEQLVPSAWIDSMTEVRSDFGCHAVNAATSTRPVRQGAGMGLTTSEVAGLDAWGAGGFGGQAILVVPDLDVVVVITQEVGPVFERRLPIHDVLDALLRTLPEVSDSSKSRCGSRSLILRDDRGAEIELSVPSSGLFSDWSPDGTQIAFDGVDHLNPEIYTVAADGTALRRLTDDGAADVLPRWSPDGTLIAFASDRGRPTRMPLPEYDLWLLDPVTGHARPLTHDLGDVLGLSWSPEQDRIVFVRTPTGGAPFGDLWWVDVRTGESELLAGGDYAWPEWSPDGRSIAYVTRRDDEPFVRILDLDSRHHIDVAPGAFPVWSPDGRSILLTRDNESVVAVDLDDTTEALVTKGCCASIAPDGQRLIVSRGS
jgi:CubicO group peptidase (beta-lactamase class C family)